MSSFSCPHYSSDHDTCQRLGDFCVPGRPGCVLFKNSGFAVPWEQRLEAKRRAQRGQSGESDAAFDEGSANE
jgi:hypothetical protein